VRRCAVAQKMDKPPFSSFFVFYNVPPIPDIEGFDRSADAMALKSTNALNLNFGSTWLHMCSTHGRDCHLGGIDFYSSLQYSTNLDY
jgi:hypothetical protein